MRSAGFLSSLHGLALAGVLFTGACGGGSGKTDQAGSVSVTLTGVPSSVVVGSDVPISAQVAGTPNTAVTWTVDQITSGNAGVGTITGSGNSVIYHAPAAPGSHVLAATSVADPSKSASAQLVVTSPSSITSVAVIPATLTLSAGAQHQFTAAVEGTGTFNNGVTWSAQRGSITSTGLYTAPYTSGSDTVTAKSVEDATKSASAEVSIQSVPVPSGVIVAPNGVPGNPGTLEAPTTLEGARTLLQNASRTNPGALRVILRGGIYPRTASFTLSSADSGSTANPVEYVAFPNETPRLVGGVSIPAMSFRLVDGTDPNWSRLDPATRSMIYVADLTAYTSSLGSLASRSDSGGAVNQGMEVFVDGLPLTLARYPKAVDASAVNLTPQATLRVSGTLTPDVTGDYTYKGLDSGGHPYYQLAKGGDVWSLSTWPNSPDWQLSDRQDLGGQGSSSAIWIASLVGPAGTFKPLAGASGSAYVAPADGSSFNLGLLLIRGTNGSTQIVAPDPRMSRWRAAEAMYYGLGKYSWFGSHSPITSLDPTTGTIVLSTAPSLGLQVGQPFFVYNLLEELTAPGDYFIDRTNARIYLRPFGDLPPSEVLLSTLQTPLVQMQGCQRITWQGISFEAAKDQLVSAKDCQSVGFTNCQFKNAGGYGLILSGSSNLVEACDFRQLGKGGVWAWGGDRKTLTPSGTLIENSQFQAFGRLFWTYQPAIKLTETWDAGYNEACMGFTVQHNEIHHGPHAAILFSGNGNTIQYNHIHDVLQWTNDAGAIYTNGCEWGMQGNLIRYDLIRNGGSRLGVLLSGIYIDGAGSGVTIEGNILYKAAPYWAIQHNGGRDVQMQYNIFYGHYYGVNISNVGVAIVNNTAGSQVNFLEKLLHFYYQSPPWSTAYPNVATIPSTWAQSQGSHWLQPEGSTLYGNLQYGYSSNVFREQNAAPSMGTVISFFSQNAANLQQVDPQSTNPAGLDFSLKPSSPMYSIPGFPGIDVSKIGIQ